MMMRFSSGFQGYNTCGLPRVAVERALDITFRHRYDNTTDETNDFFLGNLTLVQVFVV